MQDDQILKKLMQAIADRVGDRDLGKIKPFADWSGIAHSGIGYVLKGDRRISAGMKDRLVQKGIEYDWFDNPEEPVRFRLPEIDPDGLTPREKEFLARVRHLDDKDWARMVKIVKAFAEEERE